MDAPGKDDWRLAGQDRYLTGATFTTSSYKPPSPDWDHDHCEFAGQNVALTIGMTVCGKAMWLRMGSIGSAISAMKNFGAASNFTRKMIVRSWIIHRGVFDTHPVHVL